MSSSNTLIHENSNFTFPSSPSEKVDRSSDIQHDKNFLPSTPSGGETIPDSPHTPPHHHSAVTPLMQRGRMLHNDELLSCDRPAVVDGDSPGRRDLFSTGYAAASHTPFSHSALQRLLSPSTTTLNGVHQQRLMQQRNQLQMELFGGVDSPLMPPATSTNNTNTAASAVSMMWGSDMGGVRHPGEKPKRPLSAYNFYFQLERERIISSDEADRYVHVAYTEEDVQRLTQQQQRKALENKPKEKRSHRKTHGKISFGDLARTIANKWKQLQASDKEIFEGSAAQEKERYRKELAEWNKQMKKWKDAAAKMTSSLQFHHGNGALNLSNHESATPPAMSNTVVTPDQMPKKTVYPSSSNGANALPDNNHSPNSQMLQAMAQQRLLGRGGPRFTRPNAQFGRGMEYGNDDLLHPYNMNEGTEEDFYPQDALGGGLDAASYTDELTEETYRMAQMMLPPNQQQRMRRAPIHPRRMKMLLLMQQRYRLQQMMLMQMHGGNGLLDPQQQAMLLDGYDPMAEEMGQVNEYGGMEQLDDAANYMMDHHGGNGGHLVNNHFLQMQQRNRRPRLDELSQVGGGYGMDDPFAQNMMQQQQQQQNMMGLHNGAFDDRV